MIPSSLYKPRVFPIKGDTVPSEIDRAQTIDPTASPNREKVEEIGNANIVGYVKKSPTIGYRLTQYEYGSIEFYQKLVNSDVLGNDGQTEIAISDFKTPYFDICAYLTDDDTTFRGTLYYPAQRVSGFSLSISDPQAIMERSFDFVGEKAQTLRDTNKYLIYVRDDVETADLVTGDDVVISLSTREPAEDPRTGHSGEYMFRVVRVRDAGEPTETSTELTRITDYNYDSVEKELRVEVCEVGDIIKIWYSSATAPTVQFTPTGGISALVGDCASIYLYVPKTGETPGVIHRLQSVTLDVSFDREDIREIGSKDVVARGIKDSTITVTLGRILEDFTIERALAEEDVGIIDVENLSDDITLIIKIFGDNTKANSVFKYGFKATGLTPTEFVHGASVDEYVTRGNTLEGEALKISADTSVISLD